MNLTISRIVAGLALCGLEMACWRAVAADSPPPDSELEEIIITGSLIPQSRAQVAAPLTVITAQDMQERGFATVAEALQHSSLATGSVQGPQPDNGPTAAAKTLSLFGLSPSYVKYLIDGRPMTDYPALYGGTDVITNLAWIPQWLVDHIDILPGGQSSLYGSDAIAGVVNIVLKKKLDAPEAGARYRSYSEGGGVDKRVTLAGSFDVGGVTILAGGEYDKAVPLWGYQRPLTAHFYTAGTSPATAERDYLVYGDFGTDAGHYYFLDPNACRTVTGQFGNTVRQYTRPNQGTYCGTLQSGYYTIDNGSESTQVYLHATDDFSAHIQLYGDVLGNHERTTFTRGADLWSSDVTYGSFYDPALEDFITLQHIFSPEEAGGLNSIMTKVTGDAYRATLGGQGTVGASAWSYDANITHSEQQLTKKTHVLWNAAVAQFFAPVLGPNLGLDPIYGFAPSFSPDYAQFYMPVTPAQYASFSGYAYSHSQADFTLLRMQLTRASLLQLPGGPAALAVVLEGGDQGWRYNPDPAYEDGSIFGYYAVTGSGHRSRSAATSELRLPFFEALTLDISGRYDNYVVSGGHVDKGTYNLGVEVRPLEPLLVRGRYGTAFKAPTLPDEYQGVTTFYSATTDYYQCALAGYTGATLDNCPFYPNTLLQVDAGNLRLKPITADAWSAGVVWADASRFSISADYMHWKINNEVTTQDVDQLLQTEAQCRLGNQDIQSPTCVAAIAQVTRDANGQLQSVYAPKINVSEETLDTVIAAIHYGMDLGHAGALAWDASWTDVLEHTYQQYSGDPVLNLLQTPTWSQDFKTKVNGSVTWNRADWTATVYVERDGRTPNYLATINGYGADGAGTLSSWTLCNATAQYQWSPSLKLSLAVTNAFNTLPPADHSYPGTQNMPYNPYNYNVYGRSYYLEVNYRLAR